jgi:pimeloyl-ACP methyl ester carboxylesterase
MHDVIRAGAELRAHATNAWIVAADVNSALVVFVHGFTSNGRYLSEQGAYVYGHGYSTAYFNYDSYRGIDTAAADLAERLQACGERIAIYGLVLIGHSMGGLVVRACANFSLGELKGYLRGTILLGTPNSGTLPQILPRVMDWGDAIAGIDPYRRLPTCRASKQLTCQDAEKFVEHLNNTEQKQSVSYPILTISGGLAWLEVGKKHRSLRNWFANRTIQNALKAKPNDGLVTENSADLSSVLGRAPNRMHNNGYSGYDRTNHTALTRNQSIGDAIVSFLASVTR